MPPIQPQRTFGSVLGQGIGRFGNALEDLGAIRRGQNPDVLREQSRALELKILQEKLKTLEALEGTGALVQLGPEERVSLLDRLLPNMDPIIKQSVAQNPESLRALFSKDLDPATAKALTLSIFQGRLNPRQAIGAASDLLETAKAQREAASNRRLIGVLNTLEDDPSDPTTVNVYRAIRSGLGQSGFKVEDLAGIKPNLEASVTGEAGAIKTGLETQARVLSTARAKEQPVFEGGPSIREMEFREKVDVSAARGLAAEQFKEKTRKSRPVPGFLRQLVEVETVGQLEEKGFDLRALETKRGQDFLDQVDFTGEALRRIQDVEGLVGPTPEVIGAPGQFAATITELADQARGFLSLAGVNVQAPTAVETYENVFREIGIRNRELQSQLIGLAFFAIAAEGQLQAGDRLTNLRLENKLKELAANTKSPAAVLRRLREQKKRMMDRIQRRAVTILGAELPKGRLRRVMGLDKKPKDPFPGIEIISREPIR